MTLSVVVGGLSDDYLICKEKKKNKEPSLVDFIRESIEIQGSISHPSKLWNFQTVSRSITPELTNWILFS